MEEGRAIGKLAEIGKRVFEAKEKIAELKRQKKILEDQIKADQERILNYLEEEDLGSLDIDGVGKLFPVNKVSYALPKTPEDKKAFYAYLKELGIYESMVSVNSQSYNAFVKKHLEEKGEINEDGTFFKIPGVPEAPTIISSITSRKAPKKKA